MNNRASFPTIQYHSALLPFCFVLVLCTSIVGDSETTSAIDEKTRTSIELHVFAHDLPDSQYASLTYSGKHQLVTIVDTASGFVGRQLRQLSLRKTSLTGMVSNSLSSAIPGWDNSIAAIDVYTDSESGQFITARVFKETHRELVAELDSSIWSFIPEVRFDKPPLDTRWPTRLPEISLLDAVHIADSANGAFENMIVAYLLDCSIPTAGRKVATGPPVAWCIIQKGFSTGHEGVDAPTTSTVALYPTVKSTLIDAITGEVGAAVSTINYNRPLNATHK